MKVRYIELPPNIIFNWLDPFNVTAKWACKAIKDDWWSDKNIEIRQYFAKCWTEEFDKITGHFTDLEESIMEKGRLTPINLDSGPPRGTFLKPHHFFPGTDLSTALVTQFFGGSRLTLAAKLKLEIIPCIVNDYANLFPDAPEVTCANYKQWFGDEYGCYGNPPQIRVHRSSHMKNKRFDGMNANTKRAQEQAADIARKKTYDVFGLVGDK